jgi:hypothetical protein
MDFVANYRNQVNLWYSKDNGATWIRSNYLSTGFATDPAHNTGFSDPDFTQDEGGRIYDTGINLANDALFSSGDGGITWDRGTVQCHNGDRPWLAGGKKDEVFLATNTAESNHVIYDSTDGGNTCPSTGIAGSGEGFTGNGKLYYDRAHDMLFEPTVGGGALGVSHWKRGDAAMTNVKVADSTLYAHWAAIAQDTGSNLYMVWDTFPKEQGTTGGCSGGERPAANAILMSFSTDLGEHWSSPVRIAAPNGARAIWPWVAAGDPGRVSIVWYQTDKVADLSCEVAQFSVYEAHVLDATSVNRSVEVTKVVDRPIHDNNLCEGGTGCVATGEDRRLGDFFTNSLDARGCVMVATGDTTQPDPLLGGPRPTALPLFVRQVAGPSLIGDLDCATGQKIVRACLDRVAPTISVSRPVGRGALTLRGRASERGCEGGRVTRVEVAVARVSGKRCRFLSRTGKAGPATSCARRRYLRARGTSRWSLQIAKPARGRYRLWARAIDRAGNVSTDLSLRFSR